MVHIQAITELVYSCGDLVAMRQRTRHNGVRRPTLSNWTRSLRLDIIHEFPGHEQVATRIINVPIWNQAMSWLYIDVGIIEYSPLLKTKAIIENIGFEVRQGEVGDGGESEEEKNKRAVL